MTVISLYVIHFRCFVCCYYVVLSWFFFFFLMIRRPPRSTRTDTLFPYTTLFRSGDRVHGAARPIRQPVLLGARHRDHVLRRALPFDEAPAAAVHVVVALQHQVDAMTFEHRQQVLAQQRVVAILARREHRLVDGHDRPCAPARSEEHTSELQSL